MHLMFAVIAVILYEGALLVCMGLELEEMAQRWGMTAIHSVYGTPCTRYCLRRRRPSWIFSSELA